MSRPGSAVYKVLSEYGEVEKAPLSVQKEYNELLLEISDTIYMLIEDKPQDIKGHIRSENLKKLL